MRQYIWTLAQNIQLSSINCSSTVNYTITSTTAATKKPTDPENFVNIYIQSSWKRLIFCRHSRHCPEQIPCVFSFEYIFFNGTGGTAITNEHPSTHVDVLPSRVGTMTTCQHRHPSRSMAQISCPLTKYICGFFGSEVSIVIVPLNSN